MELELCTQFTFSTHSCRSGIIPRFLISDVRMLNLDPDSAPRTINSQSTGLDTMILRD